MWSRSASVMSLVCTVWGEVMVLNEEKGEVRRRWEVMSGRQEWSVLHGDGGNDGGNRGGGG